jgi:ribosomal protein L11 methylase PrmA
MRERPDRLILSGILTEEADRVLAAFAARGYRQRARRRRAEWSALELESAG